MNWLNQLNLVPKNFIVANVVDTMKEDPENGLDKVYKLASDFLPDEQIKQTLEVVKSYYDTHPSVKLLVKNICYNTSKPVLNYTLQNLCVNAGLDGHEKRKKAQSLHQIDIPPIMSLVVAADEQLAGAPQVMSWIGEGKSLGIHVYLLKGPNVLYTQPYLNLYQQHKDVQFILVSQPEDILRVGVESLEKLPNIMPLVVCPPPMNEPKLLQALTHLKKANLLYGVISDLTGEGIKPLVSPETTRSLIRHGARVHVCTYQQGKSLTTDQLNYVEEWANVIRQSMPYLPMMLKTTSQGTYALSVEIQGHVYGYEVVQAMPQQIKNSLISFLKTR